MLSLSGADFPLMSNLELIRNKEQMHPVKQLIPSQNSGRDPNRIRSRNFMEKAKVYFTNMRVKPEGRNLQGKLELLMRKAE